MQTDRLEVLAAVMRDVWTLNRTTGWYLDLWMPDAATPPYMLARPSTNDTLPAIALVYHALDLTDLLWEDNHRFIRSLDRQISQFVRILPDLPSYRP